MKNRVVITGIGLISPLGDTPEGVFRAAMAGQSAVSLWDECLAPPVAVARTSFDASRWFTRTQLTGVDRFSQFAVAAGLLACQDGNWPMLPANTGIYCGVGMGGSAALELAFGNFREGHRTPPLSIPAFMPNAAAAHLAMRLQVHGPVYTYSMACASGAAAIAEAAKAVASGEVGVALAGGSEAILTPAVVSAWQSLQTLARPGGDPAAACRPFSVDRSGLVLGEGAAFLLLEPLEAARDRGATVYAEIAGSGASSDATHLTKPDAAGQARALVAALRAADLRPDDVGYCNAHGTATQAGDLSECEALRQVWGEAIDGLQVSSTKAMHGHLLGAAGALEAAITAMALHYQALPPSAHCTVQDPACRIRLVGQNGVQGTVVQAAISNSFAFGGANIVLAFRRAGLSAARTHVAA